MTQCQALAGQSLVAKHQTSDKGQGSVFHYALLYTSASIALLSMLSLADFLLAPLADAKGAFFKYGC